MSQYILAVQFGDYRWGSSKKKIEEELFNKGRKFITRENSPVIIYKDTFMKEEIGVKFQFSPNTQVLYEITATISTGPYKPIKTIQETLMAKYGPPTSISLDDDLALSQRWDLQECTIQATILTGTNSFVFAIVYRSNFHYTIAKMEVLQNEYGKDIDLF